jgi:membrane-associated phospholipid phosphatase
MYQSMFTIAITITIMTILLVIILSKRNPFIAFKIIWDSRKDKKLWIHFALLGVILLINKLELKIENNFIHIGDYSHIIQRYEGQLLANFQSLLNNSWLTEITTFFYIIIFVTLISTSFVLYFIQHDKQLFYTFIYAIGLNYLIAIPFYLFIPVNEVWFVHPQVSFLIPEVYPDFETQYRNVSGLNNCFPSLHNSISLTLLFLSFKSNNKLFKWFMTGSVGIIMFSTIYLGIHWLTDMAAGVILAITAFTVANLISVFVTKPFGMEGKMASNLLFIKKETVQSKINSKKQAN